mmetsp:Transcript_25618/g.48521  ORF Transcript_25618/g.48521 Transcript_25618/m.48521 type:complete len:89 (-) Transcript_25618:180-446(-)
MKTGALLQCSTLEPSAKESCVAYYNLACCHAYNGNQDQAEHALQGGLRLGLDWDRCVTTAPTAELVELQASTQVRRRMMRCAQHFKAR